MSRDGAQRILDSEARRLLEVKLKADSDPHDGFRDALATGLEEVLNRRDQATGLRWTVAPKRSGS